MILEIKTFIKEKQSDLQISSGRPESGTKSHRLPSSFTFCLKSCCYGALHSQSVKLKHVNALCDLHSQSPQGTITITFIQSSCALRHCLTVIGLSCCRVMSSGDGNVMHAHHGKCLNEMYMSQMCIVLETIPSGWTLPRMPEICWRKMMAIISYVIRIRLWLYPPGFSLWPVRGEILWRELIGSKDHGENLWVWTAFPNFRATLAWRMLSRLLHTVGWNTAHGNFIKENISDRRTHWTWRHQLSLWLLRYFGV